MPIGVPKVPYQMPGDQYTQWVDIYNRLYQNGLFSWADVDDEIKQIIAVMLYLDSKIRVKTLSVHQFPPGCS